MSGLEIEFMVNRDHAMFLQGRVSETSLEKICLFYPNEK